eukprot:NODE_1127_length_1093_cov_224.982759_g861_i0.p1 GENE.NODE_1127_length_1093_cov_224.982759_g861_i0~~NODE_1127_length_1093_cov_224.982759_g861_i0.p1  ORF type:complete len:320 (-),score=76.52 NODE_1127_length_1093_cov_224.982759_g861_i0:64-1023(-)
MCTRDRTALYLQIRSALHASRAVTDGTSATTRSDRYERLCDEVRPPPEWLDNLEEVKEVERDIQTRLKQLKEMHRQHLRPKVQSNDDERDIEIATTQLQDRFKAAERCIKRLVADCGEREAGKVKGKGLSDDEHRVVQNVQIALVTSLNDLSHRFRNDQRTYLTELSKQKTRARKYAEFGGQLPVVDEEEVQRQQYLEQYLAKGFTEEQVQALINAELRTSEREKELQSIYSAMVDIHEIFKDLSAMVIEQGSLLDRIDCQVENTRTAVADANEQLTQSQQRQKKTGYWLVMLLLVVCILAVLFAFILKVFHKPKSREP